MRRFDFLVLALAIWRVANMLVNEDGPWMVFEHLRLKIGLQPAPAPDMVRETDPPGRMPGSLFACVWCLSLWVAGLFVALLAFRRKAAMWLAMPFALSSISCLLDEWGHR